VTTATAISAPSKKLINDKCIFLCANKKYDPSMTEAEVFEVVRKWWHPRPLVRDEARFAVVYAGEVIVRVYKIRRGSWVEETRGWVFDGNLSKKHTHLVGTFVGDDIRVHEENPYNPALNGFEIMTEG